MSTKSVSGRILFPESGAEQQYGQKTQLRADNTVEWYSSIDGLLGTGRFLTAVLSPGVHVVTIRHGNEILDSATILILDSDRNEYSLEIQGLSPRLVVPSGTYTPLYVSESGRATTLDLKVSSFTRSTSTQTGTADVSVMLPHDLTMWNRNSGGSMPIVRRDARAISTGIVLEEREFRIANLVSSGTGSREKITARKRWSSAKVDIWIDENGIITDQSLESIGLALEYRLIPRHRAVWGTWYDIDSNGKMSILITPVFNRDKVAIGMFNPADFYAYSDDEESPLYNPTSNQMDILYVGVPDDSGEDRSFSAESILATIAHEMQHLSSFSTICQQQQRSGKETPVTEEIFLEEGLSHLAENLAGYGVSGGNIAFVSRYLRSTYSTPLGPCEEAGYGDSIEKRGGMALLLDWLFELNGGVEFLPAGSIVDRGGITFLRNVYASNKRGWERIEEAAGLPRRRILKDFALFISETTIDETEYDPYTGEPITINPYCGTVTSLGKLFDLNGPDRIDFFDATKLPPYSIAVGESVHLSDYSSICVSTDDVLSSIMLYLQKNGCTSP